MSDELPPDFASILPARPWITLTEAATALAFGFVEDAGAFSARELALENRLALEGALSARAAVQAAAEAGFSLQWGEGFPDEIETLPAVAAYLHSSDARNTEREQLWSALLKEIREIIWSAQNGKLLLQGIYQGNSRGGFDRRACSSLLDHLPGFEFRQPCDPRNDDRGEGGQGRTHGFYSHFWLRPRTDQRSRRAD